jgi:flagellar motor component MotA
MDIATLAGVLAFLAAMLLGIIGDGSSVIVMWQPQGMVIVLGGTFGIVLLRST